jgi:hypothetical protein
VAHVEEEVFEKALSEVGEYAERRGMALAVEASSIKVVKDVTEEVERCVSEAVKEELKNAEKVCRRSCAIRREDVTKWQLRCLDICLQCWKMTKRAECAERVGAHLLDHIYAIETLLKQYGLWYHSYWRIFIDKEVLFIMEFKPPPEVQRKA